MTVARTAPWSSIDWSLPVIAAADCEPCELCGDPICPECGGHFGSCPHPGPDSVPTDAEWEVMRWRMEGYARTMARFGAGVFVIVDGPGGPITVDSGEHESDLAVAAALPRLGKRLRTWVARAFRWVIDR